MITRTEVEKVIGKGFADKLDEPIFYVNVEWVYTRRQMVEEINCANFIAAARLAKALKKLGIASPAKLYKVDPVSLARIKGIGESSIFVAMCILYANRYDIVGWWQYKGNMNKFSSFKANAMKRTRKQKQEVA